jgi:hypothetical protein
MTQDMHAPAEQRSSCIPTHCAGAGGPGLILAAAQQAAVEHDDEQLGAPLLPVPMMTASGQANLHSGQ